MRVLVTNDDGVHAPGLHLLTRALVDAGFDVVVAAPLDDRSGSGAAIGTVYSGTGIVVEEFALEVLEGVPVFGVDGPPALAVMAARLGAFGEAPSLVASGINPGCNTGRAVLHSGTVGAALTAANFGISGLAVSQDSGDPWLAGTAAAIAARALTWVAGQPPRTVLNVNVPNLPLDQLRGARTARLAPFGTVRAVLTERSEGRMQIELKANEEPLAEDTDTMIVGAGYVAVTALVGPRAVDDTGATEAVAAAVVTA
ncbi:MAG TPA: 5'/3'-nucleotidase SurE [Acidimicrobiales bacterium]|nr:5'/3'-nucleotidase SurE [Acidimicrobiales bacterium]